MKVSITSIKYLGGEICKIWNEENILISEH